jgi:hypothetical protein
MGILGIQMYQGCQIILVQYTKTGKIH